MANTTNRIKFMSCQSNNKNVNPNKNNELFFVAIPRFL